jgi:hypothetical protein
MAAKKATTRRRSTGANPIGVEMPRDSESLRIRQIKNGWLINRSGSRKGKWFDEDEFTAQKPVLKAEPAKKEKPSGPRR